MPSEPRWLTPDELVVINRLEVAETGEPHALVDRGLLESAAARPKNHWHYEGVREIADLAASLLDAVARNHPFEQGNKRTAATGALVFASVNGHDWTLEDRGEYAEWILALVQDELDRTALARLMRPHLKVR
ncbi:MAG: type II toxin-antitoxin system death-on-curing family toxin [Alphaproteobacteria bacterium]|nr:type II toxin-antitoxin system death-on-curing family toxin [Alphaproteobacteria bacterium]